VSAIESTARAGGAGLAATLAARDGREVTLITALAPDAAGRELRALLEAEGIEVVDLGLDGATPEKVRVRASGTSIVRLDRGDDGGTVGAATLDARLAIARAHAVLVADYGRGVAREPRCARRSSASRPTCPSSGTPHPEGPATPTRGATLVTRTGSEAERFAAEFEGDGVPGTDGPRPRARRPLAGRSTSR
jgi:bifunctional ADP-heptose synthase (sugar kinase/adenylyltransferase)